MDPNYRSVAARRLAECLSQRTFLSAVPEDQALPIPNFVSPGTHIPDPEHITWKRIYDMWNPPKSTFSPSEQWLEALHRLRIPVEGGSAEKWAQWPPFSSQNLSCFSKPKTGFLVVMLTDLAEHGAAVLKDMKSEATAYLHPRVLERYSLRRGSVLMLSEVTVLPKDALNVTISNISDVIE